MSVMLPWNKFTYVGHVIFKRRFPNWCFYYI